MLLYSAFHATVAASAVATRSPLTDTHIIRRVTDRTIARLSALGKVLAFIVAGTLRVSKACIGHRIRLNRPGDRGGWLV
jgi:hypothetical protein